MTCAEGGSDDAHGPDGAPRPLPPQRCHQCGCHGGGGGVVTTACAVGVASWQLPVGRCHVTACVVHVALRFAATTAVVCPFTYGVPTYPPPRTIAGKQRVASLPAATPRSSQQAGKVYRYRHPRPGCEQEGPVTQCRRFCSAMNAAQSVVARIFGVGLALSTVAPPPPPCPLNCARARSHDKIGPGRARRIQTGTVAAKLYRTL